MARMFVVGALLTAVLRAGEQETPTFEAVIQRAVEAEREGRLEEADRAFEEAARLRPDHPRVHYSLAWVRLQRGLATEALAAVNQALALDPRKRSSTC
jgi:Flp pilus assembly protein TadD